MRVSFPLLWWLWRMTWPVTLPATVLLAGHALLAPGTLGRSGHMPWSDHLLAGALLHSTALVVCLGRPESGAMAFLYSRGFSRNRLWAHQMLASAAAVITAWLPAAFAVWLPVRSWVQDDMFHSPYYPGAVYLDRGYMWPSLLLYALLLPPVHYAWIRFAQPLRGGALATLMATPIMITVMHASGWTAAESGLPWFAWLFLAAVLLLGVWSQRLHQRMELHTA